MNFQDNDCFAPTYTGYENKGQIFLFDDLNEEDDLFHLDLSNINFADELQKFKEKFKDHIDYLTTNNWEFEIGFGVVYYAN